MNVFSIVLHVVNTIKHANFGFHCRVKRKYFVHMEIRDRPIITFLEVENGGKETALKDAKSKIPAET